MSSSVSPKNICEAPLLEDINTLQSPESSYIVKSCAGASVPIPKFPPLSTVALIVFAVKKLKSCAPTVPTAALEPWLEFNLTSLVPSVTWTWFVTLKRL